ncbi:lamprin 1.8-10-like [Toxorhynchites rutilus septentrionalis]|uniref:lamprin 1.8-10-like n=1 Tax=Toxorhynchites rutilus septentrionalis TaxID=329112 RepID=UPI002479846D|nr:lamprin 1.8-10-like [Toxorhynchites rutilus septentrionalis]
MGHNFCGEYQFLERFRIVNNFPKFKMLKVFCLFALVALVAAAPSPANEKKSDDDLEKSPSIGLGYSSFGGIGLGGLGYSSLGYSGLGSVVHTVPTVVHSAPAFVRTVPTYSTIGTVGLGLGSGIGLGYGHGIGFGHNLIY